MPIDQWFDKDNNCYRFKVSGEGQQAQMPDAVKRMYADPNFKTGMSAIWDMRDANLGDMSAELSYKFSDMLLNTSADRGEAKVAIIASDQLGHGMVRMHLGSAPIDYLNFNIFDNEEDAIDWINMLE